MTGDVVVATIPKNHSEEVRVGLGQYQGHDLLQVRVWFDRDGQMFPGKAGIALRISQLSALIDALVQTKAEAERLGILPREAA